MTRQLLVSLLLGVALLLELSLAGWLGLNAYFVGDQRLRAEAAYESGLVPIVTPTHPLAPGQVITSDDLTTTDIDPAFVMEDALHHPADAVGQRPWRALVPHEPLRAAHLDPAAEPSLADLVAFTPDEGVHATRWAGNNALWAVPAEGPPCLLLHDVGALSKEGQRGLRLTTAQRAAVQAGAEAGYSFQILMHPPTEDAPEDGPPWCAALPWWPTLEVP